LKLLENITLQMLIDESTFEDFNIKSEFDEDFEEI
jgi:hypothetical protein